MPPSAMTGIRSFKFTSGTDILELADTDFWINYEANVDGTQEAELSLTLTNVWEHSDFSTAVGLARRADIEARLKILKWDFSGKKGSLLIDEGTPQEQTLEDITLVAVSTERADFNELLEYSIEFKFPLSTSSGQGGIEIARQLEFLLLPHNFALKSEQFHDGGTWPVLGTIGFAIDFANGPARLNAGMTADKAEDLSGAIISCITQTESIPADRRVREISVYVQKNATPDSYPGIGFVLKTGGPTTTTEWTLKHDTGTAVLKSGSPNPNAFKLVEDLGDYYRFVFNLTNSLNTVQEFAIYPAVNTTGTGSWIATTTGDVVLWGALSGITGDTYVRALPYVEADTVAIATIIDLLAENYVVERIRRDRTVFKDVFRAPAVRIPSGPPIEQIAVTGVKQLTDGTTPTNLEKRQDGEAKVQQWVEQTGEQGVLSIDMDSDINQKSDVAHLVEAAPSELGLPDAVVYDLGLVTGYAQ